MKVTETILTQLNNAFPDRKFGSVVDVDQVSFTPRIVITINGVRTQYGFYPSAVTEQNKVGGHTDTDFANMFVQNMMSTLNKDFNRL